MGWREGGERMGEECVEWGKDGGGVCRVGEGWGRSV